MRAHDEGVDVLVVLWEDGRVFLLVVDVRKNEPAADAHDSVGAEEGIERSNGVLRRYFLSCDRRVDLELAHLAPFFGEGWSRASALFHIAEQREERSLLTLR